MSNIKNNLLIACQKQAKLIEAQQKMLIAYRIGKTPSQTVFDLLAQREQIMRMAATAIAQAKEMSDE